MRLQLKLILMTDLLKGNEILCRIQFLSLGGVGHSVAAKIYHDYLKIA